MKLLSQTQFIVYTYQLILINKDVLDPSECPWSNWIIKILDGWSRSLVEI